MKTKPTQTQNLHNEKILKKYKNTHTTVKKWPLKIELFVNTSLKPNIAMVTRSVPRKVS